MNKIYLLSSRLVVLVDLNRSIWKNSNGLEVDITFLGLKEFRVCLPNWHASHILFSSKLKLKIPLTKSLLINLVIKCMLAYPSLLYHNQLVSLILAWVTTRQLLLVYKSFKSIGIFFTRGFYIYLTSSRIISGLSTNTTVLLTHLHPLR